MRMKAKRSMSYGRRHYAAGDEIEMSERDAKLLAAVGHVGPVTVHNEAVPADADEAKKKGRYSRRDMRAEEGED